MNFYLSIHSLNLLNLTQFHPILPEPLLPSIPDIRDLLHCLNRLHIHLSIVLHGLVTSLLELEYGVVGELFTVDFSVGFGPGEFSWVMFGLEMLMTLGPTEFKHLAIIANKCHPMTRVNWSRTKVTLINAHFNK